MKYFILILIVPLLAYAYMEDEPEHLSWGLGYNESLKTEVIIIGETECTCP